MSKIIKHLLPVLMCVIAFSLEAQIKQVPKTIVAFEKVQLSNEYVTEGASIGDINGDGYEDVIAGAICWEGPDFEKSYAYAPSSNFPITGYATNFFTFPGHFDNDSIVLRNVS